MSGREVCSHGSPRSDVTVYDESPNFCVVWKAFIFSLIYSIIDLQLLHSNIKKQKNYLLHCQPNHKNMAQGGGKTKLAAKQKSAGSQKHKAAARGKKTLDKGTRDCKPRRHNHYAAETAATTKAINKKNEAAIAAKAVAVGTQFFLTDVAVKGEKEMKKQLRERDKKQNKKQGVGGAAERVKAQLRKLGKNV